MGILTVITKGNMFPGVMTEIMSLKHVILKVNTEITVYTATFYVAFPGGYQKGFFHNVI